MRDCQSAQYVHQKSGKLTFRCLYALALGSCHIVFCIPTEGLSLYFIHLHRGFRLLWLGRNEKGNI